METLTLVRIGRSARLERLLPAALAEFTVTELPAELVRRMRSSAEFPHEVGLFLSYPPEDVKGFIENRAANAKCTGVWKVYGDERQARQTFAKYKKCTQVYCERWQSGSGLDKLAVADR